MLFEYLLLSFNQKFRFRHLNVKNKYLLEIDKILIRSYASVLESSDVWFQIHHWCELFLTGGRSMKVP